LLAEGASPDSETKAAKETTQEMSGSSTTVDEETWKVN
jgi:hypothetical protein